MTYQQIQNMNIIQGLDFWSTPIYMEYTDICGHTAKEIINTYLTEYININPYC